MVGLLMSNTEQQITTETALELLAKQQRRRILRRVADTPGETPVDRLSNGSREGDSPRPDDDSSPERGRIELHHVHLPKLQEADVIEYDADRGVVRRGREFRDVFGLLETIDEHRE